MKDHHMFFVTKKNQVLFIVLVPLFLVLFLSASAFSQTTWEFSGTPYSYQKTHFDSSTNVVKTKLGLQMHTFGAPYNQIDATFITVFATDTTNYKVLLLGQLNPTGSGQINLTNRVYIESATGVPDYAYFLTSWYSKKSTYTDYMVMQGHPYAWTTPEKLTAFQNIVNFLIATDSVVFTTPYGYYKYLTDNNIPRTNKIQVILKLDDLRATASYFYPCLPTYDFLVANKVKASFGVNKMEALTQVQIDTLHYYLSQTNALGDTLFEIWNHGLDHSMTASTTGGNWSSPSTWPDGSVPTADDDVAIPTGVTVTLDATDAACKNLTIDGTLNTSQTVASTLTVNGNILINASGKFTVSSATSGSTIGHSLDLKGNLTNNGTLDFRSGSSSAPTTLGVINLTLSGISHSTLTVNTAYSSTNGDFNYITINKTSGAKVLLGSNIITSGGSSSVPSLNSGISFTSGIVETGNYFLAYQGTADAQVSGYSSLCYLIGAFARGMSNTAAATKSFPIGDARGYNGVFTLHSLAPGGTATGHLAIVRCIAGNANTGSSSLSGGIDKVSEIRYYQVSYSNAIAGAASMNFDQFRVSYGLDDGVTAGNTNLRVAYSTDARASWTGMPPTTHTTAPPTQIIPTALTSPGVTLNSGSSLYVALAHVSGTSENPLTVQLVLFVGNYTGNSVKLEWSTISEVNNYGFNIQRLNETTNSYETIGFVAGKGTTIERQSYSFIDNQPGNTYRLEQIDNNGLINYFGPIMLNPNGVSDKSVPAVFALNQNYPNPFNPATNLKYDLPVQSKVVLKVYNLLGQELATLVDEIQEPGYKSVNFNGDNLPSGIYFYKLSAGNYSSIKKMLLMK
jgi:hypothetical protein